MPQVMNKVFEFELFGNLTLLIVFRKTLKVIGSMAGLAVEIVISAVLKSRFREGSHRALDFGRDAGLIGAKPIIQPPVASSRWPRFRRRAGDRWRRS
ncbi:hypothetical protein DBR41_25145 [Pseudomonas sp. HMWF010]|nr:hypothetical protein DBR41_25145 [Pseudomonas sp. HMWF010]